MSTTLTNGLKLPDKGSVDWYADMQNNYTILDGAVGTIAEHTTAIAGKAASSHTHTKSDVTDLLNSNFIPSANNSYDLGSSSYQWNNLYAKNYYYNGVAWGLDIDNHWKRTQILHSDVTIDIVNNPSNEIIGSALYWQDNARFWAQYVPVWGTDGSFRLELGISNYYSNGSQGYWTIVNKISKDFGTFDFYTTHGAANLGTSTYKWKTLNGINPGALSLPDKPGGSGTVNVNYFDLSGNVTVKDGSTYNSYTALCDGWIVIGSFASEISIEDDITNLATTAVPKSNGYAQAYLPVRQGDTVRITINQTNTQYQNFKLIPCQGNV